MPPDLPIADQQAWLDTFRALLRHYVPPLESCPAVNVASLGAIVVGLFLAFRSARYERAIVCTVAMFFGAWIGYRISLLIQTPEPISAAVGAVGLTALAYRTHRWWLAGGSVIVLFLFAVVFQLSRGDLQRYLPTTEDTSRAIRGDLLPPPPSYAQQQRNLYPSLNDQLAKIWHRIVDELHSLGPVGWLVPLVAAIIGGLLAWWALRIFAVIWLGFLGACLAVTGAAAFLSAHWPEMHQGIISQPQIPAQAAIGLWLLGLILQAKDARFPKSKPVEPPKPAG